MQTKATDMHSVGNNGNIVVKVFCDVRNFNLHLSESYWLLSTLSLCLLSNRFCFDLAISFCFCFAYNL